MSATVRPRRGITVAESGAVGYPTGGAMRRWTRMVPRVRGRGGSVVDLVASIYGLILTVVVFAAMVTPLARSQAAFRASPAAAVGMDTGWLSILLAVALAGIALALLSRTGPIGLSQARAAWWLPLPGERRSLLRPATALPTLATSLAGAVTLPVLMAALDPALTVPLAVAATLTGATYGATLAFVAIALQAQGRRRIVGAVGDLTVALVPVAALVIVLWPPRPLAVAGTWWMLPPALAVAVAAWRWADRALVMLHDTELRERGAANIELGGAAIRMDTRAMGRALDGDRQYRARGTARLGLTARLIGSFGPGAAIATADAIYLRRARHRLLQVASGVALALVAVLLPQLPAAAAGIGVVAGGWLAALATAQGARHGNAVPAVDAVLPIGELRVRGWRLAAPTAVMLVWALVVFAVIALLQADAGWLAHGLLLAPALAAGGVRAAYRPPPDFSAPPIVTPMGAYPPGLATVASKGIDVVILAAIPLTAAFIAGRTTLQLLAVQLVLTGVAVVLGVRPAKAKEVS
ncbi:MAG TPA: DUF6297 family protein [Actinomycetaceae bacterium]|nr:DUF6297 family protein [Actinomycetaceae bacterium]